MIQKRFKVIVEANPHLSSLMCFSKAVKGFNDPQKEIEKNFKKLVNKNDYITKDKDKILKEIVNLSKIGG